MSLESSIANYDLGISTASVSPDGESVLLVGNEGYAHLISAKNAGDRSLDVELNSAREHDFNDVSWHPRSEAALIAGDFGTAMRYEKIDHSVTMSMVRSNFGRDMSELNGVVQGLCLFQRQRMVRFGAFQKEQVS